MSLNFTFEACTVFFFFLCFSHFSLQNSLNMGRNLTLGQVHLINYTRYVDILDHYAKLRHFTLVVFYLIFDFSWVFDSVFHSLLYNLARYRLDRWSVRWVRNWLTGYTWRVGLISFYSGWQPDTNKSSGINIGPQAVQQLHKLAG